MPMSGDCFGIKISGNKAALLPSGKIEFGSISYFIESEFKDRIYCLGWDVWYGE
jgi:hypothetical protein